MRSRSRRRVVTVSACLVLGSFGGACSDGDDESASRATVRREKTPVTHAVGSPASYKVPKKIDEEYVEHVMQALDHIYGDSIRELVREREITPRWIELMSSIYTDQAFEETQEVWTIALTEHISDYRLDAGDPSTTVEKVIRSNDSCILVEVRRNFAAVLRENDIEPSHQEYVELHIKDSSNDPKRLNRTPWSLNFDGFIDGGGYPEGACRRS